MKRSDLEHWQKLMAAWDASRDRMAAAMDEAAKNSAHRQMQELQRQIAEFISSRAEKRPGPRSEVQLGLIHPRG